MKNQTGQIICSLALVMGLNSLAAAADVPARTPLKIQSAKAGSTFGDCSADRAVDGVVSGDSRWVEGWIQFKMPFNVSLAYLAQAETKITVRRDGSELVVRLEAPLNFDCAKAESGKVWLTSSNGDAETVIVAEESPNSRFFTGRICLQTEAAVQPGDGILQATTGLTVTAGYGFGYLGRRAAFSQ